jgi:farnesyl diphosphate synthase
VNFLSLEARIREIAEKVNREIDDVLPSPEGVKEDKLFEAMRYSALSGGKRLRPFLTIETSNLFGVSLECSLQTALAIELIHTYSLVHDDLPSMDNDDYRRGKPSCHKMYGEAAAILAGDGLLTYAFSLLANNTTHSDAGVRIELIQAVASASGPRGMVGGQMIDLESQHECMAFPEIVRLQRMKTGALFALSCEAGAILGKAPKTLRNMLRAYANNIGVAFQITDDLLDVEGTREETGKSVSKDANAGKATLVSCIGVDKAREHAKLLAEQAVDYLNGFDERADHLRAFAEYVVRRSK